MNFKDKKLLILAGAGPHTKLVESAKEMGVYTIVADNLPKSRYSPAKLIADESLNKNIFDIDEIVIYCKNSKIDGVIGLSIDPTQRPAQIIAEELGLSKFGTREQVLALTDKKLFKELCRKAGVDTIPEYSETDLDDGKIDYPVLVKPVDSRGSRGIEVCYNEKDLKKALPIAKRESSDNNAIIEKYMADNQDLTISYIVKDGKPTLVSIGDRYPGKTEDNLDRQLSCTIQPSRYTNMYLECVNDRVIDMIKYIGIENGPVFMQGFVDGNTVRMYDPGIRLPGNEYERIHKKATGIDLMKSIIPFVLGGKINDFDGKIKGTHDLNGLCAIQYIINVKSGTISKFEGLNQIEKDPRVVDIQQRYFVGDSIPDTGDIKHRAGEISMLVRRNTDEIAKAIEFVQKNLFIEDSAGKNLIVSSFNPKSIDNLYRIDY